MNYVELQAMQEAKATLIERLIARADKGIDYGVSAVEAMEQRRCAFGLNQTDFARVLGMQKSHYSEFVAGKRKLPIEATRRAAAIGVPAQALLQKP